MLQKLKQKEFWAHALSLSLVCGSMWGFCALSVLQTDPVVALRYLTCGSVSFSITLIGYSCYMRYFVSRHSHSFRYALLYTLFYGVWYLLFYRTDRQ